MSEDQFLLFGEIWRKYGGRDDAGADLAFQQRNGDFFIVVPFVRYYDAPDPGKQPRSGNVINSFF